MAAACDLEVHQLDFTTAFLNGALGEEVWVQQAEGYEVGGASSRLFCRLRKALYGLKQAPRAWHATLKAALQEFGFKEGDADPGLVFKGEGLERVWVMVYVDDLLVVGELSRVQEVKHQLLEKFQGKDMGEARWFQKLGGDLEGWGEQGKKEVGWVVQQQAPFSFTVTAPVPSACSTTT